MANGGGKKVKVVLYARVSKDDSGEREQEPENQLIPLRQYAQAMKYEIYKEYVDRASGANPARPAFREMMAEAHQRRFDGILIWKLDRFSREGIANTLRYIQDLKKYGIWVRSYSESWMDTSNEGISEILLSIFAWVAAEERRAISERTKAAIRRLKAIGQWKGGRPRKKTQTATESTTQPGKDAC